MGDFFIIILCCLQFLEKHNSYNPRYFGVIKKHKNALRFRKGHQPKPTTHQLKFIK